MGWESLPPVLARPGCDKNPQTKPGRRAGFDVAHLVAHDRAPSGIKLEVEYGLQDHSRIGLAPGSRRYSPMPCRGFSQWRGSGRITLITPSRSRKSALTIGLWPANTFTRAYEANRKAAVNILRRATSSAGNETRSAVWLSGVLRCSRSMSADTRVTRTLVAGHDAHGRKWLPLRSDRCQKEPPSLPPRAHRRAARSA